MEPILRLDDLRKTFGRHQAVAGVSLAVPRGSIFGLLGPNGAGKTTTIRMVMDIIGPDSGRVEVFGHPRSRADLDRIGYLPEERGLYRKMTVEEHLVFLAELRGMTKAAATPVIGDWLARVGLADRRRAKVEELSKGMQQKVQLIGTLVHEPELLILDEPFSGLDPINQGLFKEVLAGYKTAGRTVVFSTHVMEQAEKLCDGIALIAAGRVVLAGGLAEIKREAGGDTYRLRGEGDFAALSGLPGVAEVFADDGWARLVLAPDAVPGSVLPEVMRHVTVHEFHSSEPDLAEIFVQAVQAAGEREEHP